MKKLLLLALPLLLTACSDDESTAESSGQLSKIESQVYHMGEIESKYVLHYENGHPSIATVYNSDDDIVWKDAYSHANGRLISVTGYEGNVARTKVTYTYDSTGRITEVEHDDSDFAAVYSFTYNDNGTVTRTGGAGSDKVFYLNEQGLIYRQNDNGEIYEVAYDGANPVSGEGTVSKTFEYLPQALPQDFVDATAPGYGPVKANAVLAEGNLDGNEDAYASKLIKKKIVDGYTTDYFYTFTEEGYPATVKVYHNDELVAETEYFY